MKFRIKRFLSRILVCALLVSSCINFAANASAVVTVDQLDASNVFLKQEGKTTCTLCATTMMLRRYSMLRGDSGWKNITESSVKKTAWTGSNGLLWTFSYSTTGVGRINVGHYTLPGGSANSAQLQKILKDCPEGIVIYNTSVPHAVLLTDYRNGTFYCADPLGSSPSGRIPLTSSYKVRVDNVTAYWKVTSPIVPTPAPKPTPKPTSAPTPDKNYPVPLKAYTLNTGKTQVYSSIGGSAKANKIYDTDLCTINTIYTNGWCKVTFPLDKGGTDSGYVKTSVFFNPSYDVFNIKTGKQLTTYTRSNLKTSTGYAGSGDKVYVIGHTSSAVQIAYPLTAGGHKAAWIQISSLKDTIKYNANGGSGSMANGSAQYNGSINLTANKYTKKGYTFGGWNAYRSSDKTWYAGSNGWNTEANIKSKKYTKSVYKNSYSGKFDKSWITGGSTNDTYTFYAIWNPNKLSVTFNANGGSISSDTYKLVNNIVCKKSDNEKNVQSWTYNSTKENGLCNASTFGLARKDYKFVGWGTTSGGGTIFDQNDASLIPSKINKNIENGNCSITLYAIWKPVATPTATAKPTAKPTAAPTATAKPTAAPTAEPTVAPTVTAKPTAAPTATTKPTAKPTATPTATAKPTERPTEAPEVRASVMDISVENVSAKVGKEVEVKVKLENNPGITSMRLILDYDKDALTMTGFEFGEALASMNRASSEKYTSPYSFSMYSATQDLKDNGIIAVIRFRVNYNARNGNYKINISYDAADIFNMNDDNIGVNVKAGSVYVDSFETGDVNADGSINMKDIVLLQQVVNDWDVEYNKEAADYNSDGKVNMKDIVALQQYINR